MGAQSDALRQALADATTDLSASDRSEGLSAITFEDLMGRQLDLLNGSASLPRAGRKQLLQRRKALFDNLLTQIQEAAKDPPYDPFSQELGP